MTILLAEDESDLRELTAVMLRSLGYDVIEAANGLEAITLAQRHEGQIDLVLSDIKMPELDGKKLVSEMPKHRPGVKFLLISGYASDVEFLQRSGHPYLIKPFRMTEVVDKIRELMGG